MSAILLALFPDYESAERVRTDLVHDGFPTDRTDLTACCEPGRASLEPGESLHDKLVQYLGTFFPLEHEQRFITRFAARIEGGGAVVIVHPRGAIEMARAVNLLEAAGSLEMAAHDLAQQRFEFAAARHSTPWLGNFWTPRATESHCLYCYLFEDHAH